MEVLKTISQTLSFVLPMLWPEKTAPLAKINVAFMWSPLSRSTMAQAMILSYSAAFPLLCRSPQLKFYISMHFSAKQEKLQPPLWLKFHFSAHRFLGNIFSMFRKPLEQVIDMVISFCRTFLLYLVLVVSLRLMGKRQVGEMEPMELVVALLIADLASVPMQDIGIPLVSGVVPILTLLSLELLVSVCSMRSIKFRALICGKPLILLHNGRIDQKNLRRSRVTVDELTECLRQQGVLDLTQVQYAILETNGQLSVLPYPKHQPASAKDAGVRVDEAFLPVTLISDGHLLSDNLALIGRDMVWLRDVLKSQELTIRQVFLLTADRGGKLYLARKEEAS
jgi:uncharacterized membrane protein YcaP (DUF421 family)